MKTFFRSSTKINDFTSDLDEPDLYEQLNTHRWTLAMTADYIPFDSDVDLNDYRIRIEQLITTAKRVNDLVKAINKERESEKEKAMFQEKYMEAMQECERLEKQNQELKRLIEENDN